MQAPARNEGELLHADQHSPAAGYGDSQHLRAHTTDDKHTHRRRGRASAGPMAGPGRRRGSSVRIDRVAGSNWKTQNGRYTHCPAHLVQIGLRSEMDLLCPNGVRPSGEEAEFRTNSSDSVRGRPPHGLLDFPIRGASVQAGPAAETTRPDGLLSRETRPPSPAQKHKRHRRHRPSNAGRPLRIPPAIPAQDGKCRQATQKAAQSYTYATTSARSCNAPQCKA